MFPHINAILKEMGWRFNPVLNILTSNLFTGKKSTYQTCDWRFDEYRAAFSDHGFLVSVKDYLHVKSIGSCGVFSRIQIMIQITKRLSSV
jgi:hypothetical protein